MDLSASSSVGMMAKAVQQQQFGAQVVSKTLNKMNQSQNGPGFGQDSSYDFQTSVLGAYAGIGSNINITV